MKRLDKVTEKICELLKGSELNPKYVSSINMTHEGVKIGNCLRKSIKPIREAELLMALSETKGHDNWGIWDFDHIENNDGDRCSNWILGKPLSEQSSETIKFLYEILVD